MAFGRRAQAIAPADQRREARRAVSLSATARMLDGSPVDIAIDDLSSGGFHATIPLPLRVGMLLRVRLPNGRSPHARVLRFEGDRAGCEFIAPLDAATLAGLLG